MAKVFLVEDDRGVRETLRKLLIVKGHEVLFVATTLEEALSIVESGKLQEAGIDVVILDRSFPEKEGGPPVVSGPRVFEVVKKSGSMAIVIAYSGDLGVEYGDLKIPKKPSDLLQVLSWIH